MPPKRSASASPGRGNAKRVKTVNNQVDVVSKYLKDSVHCEVPGPPSCRQMLMNALPHAIGVGAASDERFKYQATLGDCIGEVLDQSVVSWQGKVAAAQKVVDDAEAEHSECVAKHDAAAKHVEDITAKIKELKETLKTKNQGEKEGQKSLTAAVNEVDSFDKETLAKQKQLDSETPTCTDDFGILKSGDWTDGRIKNKYLNKVMSLLKTLAVDKSLLGALPSALNKKGDERGQFDVKVVEECEGILKEHIDSLTKRINNATDLKREKEEGVKAATTALEAATASKTATITAISEAEAELKTANKEERETSKAVDKAQAVVSKAKAEHGSEDAKLSKATAAQESYKFLHDRTHMIVKQEEPH